MAEPDDLEYVTSVEVNLGIMRAMERIHFREVKLPRLINAIAKSLTDAGGDFSKAKFADTSLSDAEIESVIDLFLE